MTALGSEKVRPQSLSLRQSASMIEAFCPSRILGSGLIDYIQKMTIAAMAMADMKVWAQRS